MELLMYGLACDEEQFNAYIKKHNSPYSVAHYLFETALLKELVEYPDIVVFHNYILQEKSNGFTHAYVKGIKRKIHKNVSTTYLSYLNLPCIKFLSIFFSTFFRTLKWGFNKRKNSEKYVISTINYFPVSLANYLATRILNIKNLIILTDCSSGYAYHNSKSGIKSFIKNSYAKLVESLEKKYDAYIFFSEGMNEHINKHNRPWIVMEGMYATIAEEETIQVEKKKAIMYAGTLQPHLGIEVFVEAFKRLPDPNVELWIYGDGDYRFYVQKQAKLDTRIKYFGFTKREVILKKEKEAKLLVNTRNPEDAYTWMSFPSKTFEYMVSETPFLTTKIKGIPSEYYNYLYTTEYDVTEISKKMAEIMRMKQEDVNDFGKKASIFIKENKNQFKQTKKIYEFIKQQ